MHGFLHVRHNLLAVSLATTVFGLSVWSSCHPSTQLPADLLAVTNRLPETVDYNLHVKPILSDRCFACHGPDKAKQKAGLRLDTPEGAYDALTESGKHPIVPGDLNDSEVFHRITSTDPDVMMPTPESNLTLTAEEKALIARWIEQGAEYKPHWSLMPPVANQLPEVKETSWSKNDIDRFVLSKLEAKDLKHAPEADKATLLRRVSLDITGLPPTPAEVDAFLADQSPTAYEKVVDRLLASPHYGERLAADWLDIARYADTHGYQDDGLRTMWPYRDWVIKAFNQNLPYSTFITWQLAGDLLPTTKQNDQTNRDRLIATAFNRNHQQSQEGGIVDEEYRVEYVADRANTFGKAMLGLTVECARCHDHKYDPISQKDYYSLFAFFNGNNDRGQIPYNGEPSPTITLPEPDVDAKLRFIREKLTPIAQQLNLNRPDYQHRYSAWLAQTERNPVVDASSGLIAHYTFDEANRGDIKAYVKAENERRQRDAGKRTKDAAKKANTKKAEKKVVAKRKTRADLWKDPRNAFWNEVNDTLPARLGGDSDKYPYAVAGRFGKARFLPGDSFIELPADFGAFEQNQPFTISSWFTLAESGMAATLLGRTTGPMDGQRGYQLDLLTDGRLKLTLNHVWPDNAIDIESVDKVPAHQWFQVAFTWNGMGRANGLTLYLNGKPMRTRVITDNLQHSTVYGKNKSHWAQNAFYVGRMHDYFYKNFAVDELRIYNRCLTSLELPLLAGQPDGLSLTLRTPAAKRTPAQRTGLYTYYVTTQDSGYHQAFAKAMRLRGEQIDLLTNARQVMVMKERSQPRKSFILKRGAYDMHGDEVTPATPAQLAPFPANLPKNRLGLAQWLLLPDNTLFSRVAVNRFWQQYFGKGLVASVDDFGNQGALPTHLELLDYLAVRFRDGDGKATGPWNVKALQKLIVMSATYRQSSRFADATVAEKAREADWDNSLLSRGPSYRMSAEQVRDIALTASGLLNQQVGGPSVLPYQPAGIWEALATRNAVVYKQSQGDSIYRRSLYTIWKRSSPPPMMLDFDASERAFCIVKRQKTSTPLQALVTLNDPQFVEAARVLAQKEQGKGAESREAKVMIAYFFKAVLSRPVRPTELTLMQQLYAEELADFRKNPKRAAALLTVGEYPVDKTLDKSELAAWTVVASTIMNHDEAIIKR